MKSKIVCASHQVLAWCPTCNMVKQALREWLGVGLDGPAVVRRVAAYRIVPCIK
jgi:hypothetical protein